MYKYKKNLTFLKNLVVTVVKKAEKQVFEAKAILKIIL